MRILVSMYLLLFISQLSGQNLTGPQIIEKVNAVMNQDAVYARMTMTIITSSGSERTFEYDSWSANKGEKNLMRYLKPARVKDQATLMLNHADDIWVYFPRTRRVRKLASHAKKQKMEGSDFTYEDMGSGDAFITNFSAKRLADETIEDTDCYKLELTRKKDVDSHYSRIIMWVTKAQFFPLVLDYYDEDDPDLCLKRLVQSDIQMIEGIPTGMKMVMYNKLDNTQTTMKILSCNYNVEIDDAMFTERGLKR